MHSHTHHNTHTTVSLLTAPVSSYSSKIKHCFYNYFRCAWLRSQRPSRSPQTSHGFWISFAHSNWQQEVTFMHLNKLKKKNSKGEKKKTNTQSRLKNRQRTRTTFREQVRWLASWLKLRPHRLTGVSWCCSPRPAIPPSHHPSIPPSTHTGEKKKLSSTLLPFCHISPVE